MSNFVFKRVRPVALVSFSPYLPDLFYFIRIRSFSASPTSLESIDSSFTVDYLINSCGLNPKKAISASKYLKFEKADKPNSVLNLFKDHGFTETQISTLIGYAPRLLVSNPQKTLLPKIEFFKSKGFSASDVAAILSRSPQFLGSSLKNNLIPLFDIYRQFLLSDEKLIAAFKRVAGTNWIVNAKRMEGNIEVLKKAGASIKNIGFLFTYQPTIFLSNKDRFRQIVEEVTKLGISPSRVSFVVGIQAFSMMSKSNKDKKFEVYKKWGWSEDDILYAFRKNPWCMIASEDKINSVMEYWVSKMGWKSLFLAKRPITITYSLEKRIVPRCEVYRFLVTSGSLKPSDGTVATMLNYSENYFREKFINHYKDEAPDLLKLYDQKLDLAK